jgi:hypothetical protein
MMDVSRHKSVDTLRGYVRDADMSCSRITREQAYCKGILRLCRGGTGILKIGKALVIGTGTVQRVTTETVGAVPMAEDITGKLAEQHVVKIKWRACRGEPLLSGGGPAAGSRADRKIQKADEIVHLPLSQSV